jgi:hypothetical protein
MALNEVMDVSDLAQMMPKLFAGKNILKSYEHFISSLGRLRLAPEMQADAAKYN